jgi:hypothetical protein
VLKQGHPGNQQRQLKRIEQTQLRQFFGRGHGCDLR